MVTSGYKGLKEVTRDEKGLEWITTRNYRGLQEVTGGCKGLHWLQRVTGGYKWLQEMRRG